MAYYEIGTEQLNADYTPSAKAPFDARRYVGKFEELLSLSTFKSRVYEGMEVVVVEENCIYQLLALEEAYKKNNAYKQFSLDIDLKSLWKRTTIETITTKEALQRAKSNLVNGALIYVAKDITLDDGTTQKSGFYFCKNVDGEGKLTLAGGGEIVDVLTSDSSDKALSANQGRLLSNSITNLSNETNTRLGALSNNIEGVKAAKNDLEVEVVTSFVLSNNKDVYVYEVPADTEYLSFTEVNMTDGKLKEVIYIIDNSKNTKICTIAPPNGEGIEVIQNIEDLYVNPNLSSEFSLLIDTTGDTTIIRIAGLIKE